MTRTSPRYRTRAEAGSALSQQLSGYAGQNVLVLGVGLPGVVAALPVARSLGADLDVVVARRLTEPGQPDRVRGALAAFGGSVQGSAEQGGEGGKLQPVDLMDDRLYWRELDELRRLEDRLRGGRGPERVAGRLAIVVTDGLASPAVMRAAISVVRQNHPARLVVAVPAATAAARRQMRIDADQVICPWLLGPVERSTDVYPEQPTVAVSDICSALAAWNSGPVIA